MKQIKWQDITEQVRREQEPTDRLERIENPDGSVSFQLWGTRDGKDYVSRSFYVSKNAMNSFNVDNIISRLQADIDELHKSYMG